MKNKWLHIIATSVLALSFNTIGTAESIKSSETNNSTIESVQTFESATSSSSETVESSITSSTTNSETDILDDSPIIEDNSTVTKLLTPQYGVLKNEVSFYYNSLEDAINNTDPIDVSAYKNTIIMYDEIFTNNNETFLLFTTPTGETGFIHSNDLSRKEQHNYYTLTPSKGTFPIYSDTGLTNVIDSSLTMNRTLKTQELFTINQKNYVSLIDSSNKLVGFIEENKQLSSTKKEGQYIIFEKYATLNQNNKNIYQNFNFDKKSNTSQYLNKTFYAKGIYYHSNGENFLSLYDNKNKWIGYINQKDVAVSSDKQGAAIKTEQYINLTKKNYSIWQNFGWKKKNNSNNYMNQTLTAKYIYQHFNGNTYLSLYNNNNQWLGYINAEGTQKATGPQGIYYSHNQYVTIKSKNYDIWNNFNWNKRNHSSTIFGQTYQARGIYYHFNGQRYLSLYDNKGYWVGYINQNATSQASGPQGIYQNYNKYVSVSTSNYPIWQNFNWKQKSSAKNYRNQTLYAKGIYHHYNGSSYYSLYNNKNQWLGYVNTKGVTLASGAQGIYYSYGKNETFSNSNYTVWRDFNWKNKNTNFSIKNKTLMARGIYHHFNGSSYYSIYNGNTWIGYVNTDAARNYDMNKLIPNQESLLAVNQIVQQKILDTSQSPRSIIDNVLSMKTISRNDIKYSNGYFVVNVSGRGVGMNSVKLTPKEIAPGVNYKILPANEIKGAIPSLKSGQKYVALTFDDGPNPSTTPQLLNILKQKNVKATFFMLGNSVNANPQIAKRVANEGHQIGSHSYSHPQLTGLGASQIQSQMRSTDKAIYFATGKLPTTFRPPYGAINRNVSNTVSKPAIMWSIDTRDWESRNPTAINNVVNRNIHNGAIILLHDIHQPSVNSVSTMIDNLKRQGYQFVTIDEMYQMQQRPLHGYFSRTNTMKY